VVNLGKKGINILPGDSKDLFLEIPKDKEIGEIVLNYDDKYGNKYETRALVNLKERKIIRQVFRKLKVIKDVGDDIPKLVVDEDSIDWRII
jgi:hypothetical protein